MLKLIIILQFISLVLCDRKCLSCSSQDANSDCKRGNTTKTATCPSNQQSCYAEEFVENGSSTYRRGCSNSNFCERESRSRGDPLKYCTVCNGCDKCNSKPIQKVKNLSCQRCASEDENSDCRNGKIKEKFVCPDDEQACYTEDIINEGRPPFYRRGCAPVDWCQTQIKAHDTALKFCSVCTDASMCNNKRIGAQSASKLQCYSCNSEDVNSACRNGYIDNDSKTCGTDQICVQYYVATSRRDIYVRGCGASDECSKLGSKYGHSLEKCDTCSDDYCNNEKLPVAA